MYGLFLETLKPLTVTILNDEETNENKNYTYLLA